MSSSRLPGKVLRPARGKPMLQYVIERAQNAAEVAGVVVATSDTAGDDPVAALCGELGVACHRGPLADVAARFLGAVRRFGGDAFVRIGGDSPLIDPALIDRGVRLFRDQRPDLATNVFPRSYPAGQSVEVVDANVFGRVYDKLSHAGEREHVTLHFYNHPDGYRIVNFKSETDFGSLRLSVDTAEDFAVFERLVEAMAAPQWGYGLGALVSLLDRAGDPAGTPRA